MKNDKLFRLIKSLTREEKSHLRKYANSNGYGKESNYSRLFDLINKMDVYDESLIRKKFQGEKFLSQLHVTKAYLYQLILKSLSKSAKNIAQTILNFIVESEILYNKGLYKESLKHVEKGLSMAKLYGKSSFELILVRRKKKIISALGFPIDMEMSISEIFENEKRIIAKEEFNSEVDYHIFTIFNEIRRHGYQVDMSKLLSPAKKYASTLNANDLSEMEKMNFFKLLGIINALEKNFEKAKSFYEKIINLYEANDHWIEEYQADFLIAKNNLIVTYLNLSQGEEALKHLNSVKLLKNKFIDHQVRFFITYTRNHIRYSVKFLNFQDVSDNFKKFMKEFSLIEKSIDEEIKLTLYFNLATAFIFTNEQSKSRTFLDLILNTKYEVRKDVQLHARLLLLIQQFEGGKMDLLPYTLRNTKNYFSTVENPPKVSEFIFAIFKSIINEEVTSKLFGDFLETYRENYFESHVFPYEFWLTKNSSTGKS